MNLYPQHSFEVFSATPDVSNSEMIAVESTWKTVNVWQVTGLAIDAGPVVRSFDGKMTHLSFTGPEALVQ